MIDLIDKELDRLIIPHSSNYESLLQGARYSLLAPGKRIRPLLTLCTSEMLRKGSISEALSPACAIEMIHCFSLIHDDLPCIDNDDFRRGKPTLHKVYSDGHAVLIGDYLLNCAFEVISNSQNVTAEQKIVLIRTLSRAVSDMLAGQIMDIEKHPLVQEMNKQKTASLFRCAVLFGCIIARSYSEIEKKLSLFGENFGEMFQLVDDLNDKNHPLGEKNAKNDLDRLQTETLELLDGLNLDTSKLKELTISLANSVSK